MLFRLCLVSPRPLVLIFGMILAGTFRVKFSILYQFLFASRSWRRSILTLRPRTLLNIVAIHSFHISSWLLLIIRSHWLFRATFTRIRRTWFCSTSIRIIFTLFQLFINFCPICWLITFSGRAWSVIARISFVIMMTFWSCSVCHMFLFFSIISSIIHRFFSSLISFPICHFFYHAIFWFSNVIGFSSVIGLIGLIGSIMSEFFIIYILSIFDSIKLLFFCCLVFSHLCLFFVIILYYFFLCHIS